MQLMYQIRTGYYNGACVSDDKEQLALLIPESSLWYAVEHGLLQLVQPAHSIFAVYYWSMHKDFCACKCLMGIC